MSEESACETCGRPRVDRTSICAAPSLKEMKDAFVTLENELTTAQQRIAELEDEDRQWEKHSLVQIVQERGAFQQRAETAERERDEMYTATRQAECVYCGYRTDSENKADGVQRIIEHVKQCPNHPMGKECDALRADLERAERELKFANIRAVDFEDRLRVVQGQRDIARADLGRAGEALRDVADYFEDRAFPTCAIYLGNVFWNTVLPKVDIALSHPTPTTPGPAGEAKPE